MKKPVMIFLCGASAVGKTSLIDYLNQGSILGGLSPQTVNMKARDIRAMVGSPSWDKLESSQEEPTFHQMFIMSEYYLAINNIYKKIQDSAEPAVYVFERSLLDVAGYSKAFNLPNEFIVAQKRLFCRLNTQMSSVCNILIYHMKINSSTDYAEEEARPGGKVRSVCARYLVDSLGCMSHLNTNPSVRYSGSSFLDIELKAGHVGAQLVGQSRKYPGSIWD